MIEASGKGSGEKSFFKKGSPQLLLLCASAVMLLLCSLDQFVAAAPSLFTLCRHLGQRRKRSFFESKRSSMIGESQSGLGHGWATGLFHKE
jgi:hypothetical protein